MIRLNPGRFIVQTLMIDTRINTCPFADCKYKMWASILLQTQKVWQNLILIIHRSQDRWCMMITHISINRRERQKLKMLSKCMPDIFLRCAVRHFLKPPWVSLKLQIIQSWHLSSHDQALSLQPHPLRVKWPRVNKAFPRSSHRQLTPQEMRQRMWHASTQAQSLKHRMEGWRGAACTFYEVTGCGGHAVTLAMCQRWEKC